MKAFWSRLFSPSTPPAAAAADVLASLVVAAREDAAFREQVLRILHLPLEQREPIVRTAVEEMRLRGEPAAVQHAFAALATPDGARVALQLLEQG